MSCIAAKHDRPKQISFVGNCKRIKALPFSWYYGSVIFLAVAGWVDSLYLSISHYRVYTDMGYRSFCAISKAINCDTVSQSHYSILLGVPIPVWGLLGYTLFLSLLGFGSASRNDGKQMWGFLFQLSAIFSAYSVVLAFISTFLIHSYCIMCILSYGVNFGLLYFVWLIRKRFYGSTTLAMLHYKDIGVMQTMRGKTIAIIGAHACVAVILMAAFPAYWQLYSPALSDEITNGVTKEGYPWIGAAEPEIEITEFADYQCFQCKKMHFFLRELIQKYPNKVRLIHRQFPMDNQFNPLVKEPFHVGSARMSLLAEYAKVHGKFWQMNDLLFEIAGKEKAISAKTIGEKVGLDPRGLALASKVPRLRYALKHDIAVGIDLGITGTPGFVIEGKVYQGQIPSKILRRIIG